MIPLAPVRPPATSCSTGADQMKKRGDRAKSDLIQRAQGSMKWRRGGGALDVIEIDIKGHIFHFCQKPGQEAQDLGGTGSTVWNCAFVMSKYLEKLSQTQNWKNKRILEVGSGTGVVGIACALLLEPQLLVMTDMACQLPLMQKNLDQVQAQLAAPVDGMSASSLAAVRVEEFDWSRPEVLVSPPPYDIVVASDCVWPKIDNTMLINALLSVTNSNPQTLIVLAYEQRGEGCRMTFFQKAEQYFHFERIPISELHQGFVSDDIELYNIRRK